MANRTLVDKTDENAHPASSGVANEQENLGLAQRTRHSSPPSQEASPLALSLVRRYLESKGISESATNVIEQSWRPGTNKQYATYLKKWSSYCSSRNIDPLSPTVVEGVNFLAELFDAGIGYRAINTARSALSSVISLPNGGTFGTNPLVCRLLRDVFQLKPSLPRYNTIQDVKTVLQHLSTLHPP